MLKNMKKVAGVLALTGVLLGTGVANGDAFARQRSLTDNKVDDSASQQKVRDAVATQVSGKNYKSDTGDTISGSKLYKAKDGNVTDEFDKLTENDKKKFLTDVDNAVQKKHKDSIEAGDETNPVTDDTVNQFWDQLKRKDTVASRMIVTATKDIRPDFFGASNVLKPFTPAINIATAIFVLLAAFAFFLFLAADLFFFMAPPLQYYVLNGADKGGMSRAVSLMISQTARDSLTESQKTGKNPMTMYMVRSWVRLLIFAVFLLYFASNSMLTLVGPAANFFGGFLGF